MAALRRNPKDYPHADDEVATAILTYLEDRPSAMDTLEGIAGWWIRRQRIQVEVDRVARVIARLIREGSLEEIRIGETSGYRLSIAPGREARR